MLIQFNFKNYKSFREEASLDMTATRISEHQEHVVETGGDKLLTLSAIYGANASGKSNVCDAFSFMKEYVLHSFTYGGENDDNGQKIQITPFEFDKNSRYEESEFEVFFIDPGDSREHTYQYGFCVRGFDIVEEWLYSKAKSPKSKYKTVFYRKDGEELDISGLPQKAAENIKISLEPETLIVSLGAKLRITKLKMVRDWFQQIEILNFGSPVENYFRSTMLPKGFVEDKSVRDNVIKYLSAFDDSIIDFAVEEVKSSNIKVEKLYDIRSIHRLSDSDRLRSIPLLSESSGTLKMFSLYPALKSVLDNGSVLVVDELNARLHPLLVRDIMLTFLNPEYNPNHAQLIMTTHDIWQFSNEVLRRDELWITEKDSNGVSTLYSVADFKDPDGNKARRNEALAKNYLVGNYGGIPEVKPFDIVEGGNSDGKTE